jgi:hypothetical protein
MEKISNLGMQQGVNKKQPADFAAEVLSEITSEEDASVDNVLEEGVDWIEIKELPIETKRIKEIVPQLKNLAGKIIESKKKYDLILSDDASGRLVSLFLKSVLDEVQQKRGGSKPDLKFVAAGRHMNQEVFNGIKEFLRKISPERMLLVTEYIETGRGMEKLIDIIQELNIKFDIASVSVSEVDGGLRRVSEMIKDDPDQELYFGEIGKGAIALYGQAQMSGVVKLTNISDSPHPLRYRDFLKDNKNMREDAQAQINKTRKDLHVLADQTIEDFEDKI